MVTTDMFNDWFLLIISHLANDLKHQKYSNLGGRTIQMFQTCKERTFTKETYNFRYKVSLKQTSAGKHNY